MFSSVTGNPLFFSNVSAKNRAPSRLAGTSERSRRGLSASAGDFADCKLTCVPTRLRPGVLTTCGLLSRYSASWPDGG